MSILRSTYLGGSEYDVGNAIALDTSGAVFITGSTSSPDFPTQNPLKENRNGSSDAFITKISRSPEPDIKANGSDESITITRADTLTVTVALIAGPLLGTNADWGLAAKTPLGWYYYDLSAEWLPGREVALQRPLIDLPSREVFNMSGLPAGTYTFYFGVDLVMDGSIDMNQAYYDQVSVTINP
jgi:hypothetical protein